MPKTQTLQRRLELPVSVQAAWDWHMRPDAFTALKPPWQTITMVHDDGAVANGSKVIFKVHLGGPIKKIWEAVHENVDPPGDSGSGGFRDRQVRGPFAYWTHDHLLEATDDGCVLIDRVEYALPMGALGRFFGGGYIRKDLEKLFDHRHTVTAEALRG